MVQFMYIFMYLKYPEFINFLVSVYFKFILEYFKFIFVDSIVRRVRCMISVIEEKVIDMLLES